MYIITIFFWHAAPFSIQQLASVFLTPSRSALPFHCTLYSFKQPFNWPDFLKLFNLHALSCGKPFLTIFFSFRQLFFLLNDNHHSQLYWSFLHVFNVSHFRYLSHVVRIFSDSFPNISTHRPSLYRPTLQSLTYLLLPLIYSFTDHWSCHDPSHSLPSHLPLYHSVSLFRLYAWSSSHDATSPPPCISPLFFTIHCEKSLIQTFDFFCVFFAK